MKSYKEIRDKNIDQIKDVIDVYDDVNRIAISVNGKIDFYTIEKIIADLRKQAKRFDIDMDGTMEPDRAYSSTKIFMFKTVLARKIMELINHLVEGYAENPKLGKVENISLELENNLGKLGYTLFGLPIGSIYDFSIDPMFTYISNKDYVNKVSKHNSIPMYISKSNFGLAENRNGEYGKVIEKARVELTEDPKIIGKKKSIEKNNG